MTVLNRAFARRLPRIHERQNRQEVAHAAAADRYGALLVDRGEGLFTARCAAFPQAEAHNMISGFHAAAAPRLAAFTPWYDAVGAGAFARIDADEAAPAAHDALVAAGFALEEAEAWSWARPDALHPPRRESAVVVEQVGGPGGRALWARIAREGWDLPVAQEDFVRDTLAPDAAPAGWLYFLAYLDGEPAGEALLTIEDEAGYLADAAVPPRFRGRGVHGALLRARAAAAAQAGCSVIFAGARYGSASHANMARVGLALAHVTLLWRRAARGPADPV